jgi:hypothetical protein
MNKLIAAVVATIALLFGGAVTLAPAASADPAISCEDGVTEVDCQAPECDGAVTYVDCGGEPPTSTPCATDQIATDYRTQLAAANAKVDRLERVAERRAALIERLRAKIRKLR